MSKTPLKVQFWGTRGSIPTPGRSTLKYGGNTSCIEIRWGEHVIICDSGTGIRPLGEKLLADFKGKKIDGDLLITHTHWDHIQGFPFFVPAYIPGNRFRVHSVSSVGDSFENILRRQMGMNYFPVEVSDMASQIEFFHASPEFEIGDVKVKSMFTNHPGVDAGYRFEFPDGRCVIYFTDHENHQAFAGKNELSARQDREIVDFCRGADVLVCDSQYTDEEYESKRGWGHSRWKDTVQLGLDAEVRKLVLFHHEPSRSDEDIEKIEKQAKQMASVKKLEVSAAAEGREIVL